MALITRLSRLFQADFHAVLDRIEEPDIQLRQAVREMEFDLQQDEQALALLQHELEHLSASIEASATRLTAFDEELDICFSAKKDDLARDLIRRKLEAEAARSSAEKRFLKVTASSEKRQHRIGQHRQQLDNMRQKLDLLVDNHNDKSFYDNARSAVRNEDIEIAFLREKQRRSTS
ncbi:MAG: PspA/IM30 family protein [Gammaproteobacteria bacterium]|nr:PspA/IM30 family protein [Gammaproteobacteria bacterium]